MYLATRALVGALFLGLSLTANSHSATISDHTPTPGERFPMAGTVIVKFQATPQQPGKVGVAQVDALLEAHGLESMHAIAPFATPRKAGGTDLSRIYMIRYASGVSPQYLSRQLEELPGIEYAEPKWLHWIAAVPNDPWWGTESAYMSKMKFDAAWDVVKGDQGSAVVAVVDGGTDWDHRDLIGNAWSNPGEIDANGIDDDNNGFIDDVHGWNFGNNSPNPTGLGNTPVSGQHGTHVGGIIAGFADNALDVTGGSWNSKLMGICAGLSGADGVIGYGYEGIIYAAANGADIINCSWGGLGAPSSFELQTIEWAMEQGALVIAAAGNQSTNVPHYPSSYAPVLSVVNVTNTDIKNGGSNYGPDVDVCAQGTGIRSTFPNDQTNVLTGTSMASPHVAAVAALVKTRFPGYIPQQVRERVRVTCDNIDTINFGFAGQLGRGRVNALRAVTDNTPAIRISQIEVLDQDGDGVVEPGELLNVKVWVTNFLAPVTGLAFTLAENSTAASMVDDISFLASIDSMETRLLSAYQIQIDPGAALQTTIELTLDIASTVPVYFDKDHFEITVLPVFVNHVGNNVETSVSSNGRMGFAIALGGNGKDGIGFKYKGSSNLMFEGSLMIGDSVTRVVDSARGTVDGSAELEFTPSQGGTPVIQNGGGLADQTSVAQFTDAAAASPMNIDVLQQAYQFAAAPDDDYIIIKHTITNRGGSDLTGVRIGHFFDWDLDGSTFGTNRSAYDAARGLGYVWDNSGGAGGTYVGMLTLNPEGTTSFKGIWNKEDLPQNPDWGIYDSFTTAEKWDALTEGFLLTDSGPADISTVIATGPFNIAVNQEAYAAFAFLAGDNLPDLQANADAAAARWALLSASTPVSISDLQAVLDAGDVVVSWRTDAEQDIAAFRVLRSRDGGGFAAIGADLPPEVSGRYQVRDAEPLPGVYTYRIAEVGTDGSVVLHQSTRIEVTLAAPMRTFLAPNTPNPFNPSTTLQYGLSSPGPVRMVIYDGRGRRVRTLVQEDWLVPGEYRATWNGTDDSGRAVASGVYFARLELAGRALQRRMTLLK